MAADSSVRLSAPQCNLLTIVPLHNSYLCCACGGSAHSTNGNHGASRKRLKPWRLTNTAIDEGRQNWRMLEKGGVGGMVFLMRSFSSSTIFSINILVAVVAPQSFRQM